MVQTLRASGVGLAVPATVLWYARQTMFHPFWISPHMLQVHLPSSTTKVIAG